MMIISLMFAFIACAAVLCVVLLWMIHQQTTHAAKALEMQMRGLGMTHLQGLEVVAMTLERLEKRVKAIEDEVA